MSSQLKPWNPQSWSHFPAQQQPVYEDGLQLQEVLNELHSLPPLVFHGEVDHLKTQLARAARGEYFILQGGDCAERFQDCNLEAISSKLKIMLQMSVVLCYGLRKPIIRIGRIAGQYAKPRSSPTENVNGRSIDVYRGDIINSFEASPSARKADPSRMKRAYFLAASTLNYVRALTKGGFADLHQPHNWDLSFMQQAPQRLDYERIVLNIRDAIHFMEALGHHEETLRSVEFYTSHEGLLLPFEAALTKYVASAQKSYNLGAHMLWIGDRTRDLNGAHIEYYRGIANPIGIKVGPSSNCEEIAQICARLNPEKEEGKIVLITRFGQGQVEQHLPRLIETIRSAQHPVVWSVDPMHGNGIKTERGIKTRDFNAILAEIAESFAVHSRFKSSLGGIHFELTGQDVTECIGGSTHITAEQLSSNYETYCDPRLNYSQSLEMALLISRMMGIQPDN